MNGGHRIQDNAYSPDVVLSEIFTGADAVEREQCRSELAGLGTGPEGDRLRELFRRLVTMMQRRSYLHHGGLIWSSGRPMRPAEVAAEVVWDVTTIKADLKRLADVGLIEQQVVQNVGGCN